MNRIILRTSAALSDLLQCVDTVEAEEIDFQCPFLCMVTRLSSVLCHFHGSSQCECSHCHVYICVA